MDKETRKESDFEMNLILYHFIALGETGRDTSFVEPLEASNSAETAWVGTRTLFEPWDK